MGGSGLLGTHPIKEVRGAQKADVKAAQVLGCSLPTADTHTTPAQQWGLHRHSYSQRVDTSFQTLLLSTHGDSFRLH